MNDISSRLSIRFLIYLTIAVLIYLIYIAAIRGASDVTVYNVRVIMDDWAKGQLVEENKWNEAHQTLLTALASSPENPDYLSLLGNLYEWRVAYSPLNSPDVISDYQKSLEYYRLALKRRPAFAFYWANIAVVKSILNEVDKEYYVALERSLTLGAWEPGVQLKIADATLNVWYLLDDHGWQLMVKNIERGLISNASVIMKTAKRVKILNKLCGKLRRTEKMLQFCK